MDPISVWMSSIGIRPDLISDYAIRRVAMNVLQTSPQNPSLLSIITCLLEGRMSCCVRNNGPCENLGYESNDERAGPLRDIITGDVNIKLSCKAIDLVLRFQLECVPTVMFEHWTLRTLGIVGEHVQHTSVIRALRKILRLHGTISKIELVSDICNHISCTCKYNAKCRVHTVSRYHRICAIQRLLETEFGVPIDCLSVCLMDHYRQRHGRLPDNTIALLSFVTILRSEQTLQNRCD